ncbi:FAD-dependent oxidoreductase, partial [Streptomyces sp. P17]|uniref:FAD-dependent oxidoreductase n=1 Tax=Streptomyces sp. P17 TaxID=3074716 RepID=UPI0037DDBB1B
MHLRRLRIDRAKVAREDVAAQLGEAGPRILGAFAEDLSASSVEQLGDLGVEVHTNAKVTKIDDTGVTLDGTTKIPCSVVLWGAGVRATP